MAITDWAVEDRPREKLLARGPKLYLTLSY